MCRAICGRVFIPSISRPRRRGAASIQGAVTVTTALDYWVKGLPQPGGSTFRATLDTADGFLVTYSEPIRLTAALQRGELVAGLVVTGVLVDPYGTVQPLPFRDDGISPDPVAEDGIYSALYPAQINGDYHAAVAFSNSQGSGQLTSKGLVVEPTVTVDANGNATIVTPTLTTTPVTTNFVRRADLVLTVTGAPILGPNDERAANTGPVELQPNNVPLSGRISAEENSTRYQLTVPDPFQGEIFVRITNLELGMNPSVQLVNETVGWARLVTADPPSTPLYIPVPAAPGETIYIDVAHVDANATQGVYAISAGLAQPQGLAVVPANPGLVAPGQNVYLPVGWLFGHRAAMHWPQLNW